MIVYNKQLPYSLNVSQRFFADVIGASEKTVESRENEGFAIPSALVFQLTPYFIP